MKSNDSWRKYLPDRKWIKSFMAKIFLKNWILNLNDFDQSSLFAFQSLKINSK